MASLLSLRDYGSESDSELEDAEELVQHLKPIESAHTVGKELQLVVSPEVTSTVSTPQVSSFSVGIRFLFPQPGNLYSNTKVECIVQ